MWDGFTTPSSEPSSWMKNGFLKLEIEKWQNKELEKDLESQTYLLDIFREGVN